MAVGDPDPFFLAYQPLMFDVIRAAPTVDAIDAAFAAHGPELAGFIAEPLLRAGGMVIHDAAVLRRARALCTQHDVCFIADEVMTGFGRTGALFACGKAGISPDLMCLAKGLTGGTYPLSVTMCREDIFQDFVSNARKDFFPHGHTMTGNPIGCALALTSIDLCAKNDVPSRLEHIGQRIVARVKDALAPNGNLVAHVQNLRHIGGIVALDLATPGDGYMATMGPRLRQAATAAGVLLRPLGNVLYAMPPACTDDTQCDQIADVMVHLATDVYKSL